MPDDFAVFERHKRGDDCTVAAETFNEFGLIVPAEGRSAEGRDCHVMLGTFFDRDDHQPSIVLPASSGQGLRWLADCGRHCALFLFDFALRNRSRMKSSGNTNRHLPSRDSHAPPPERMSPKRIQRLPSQRMSCICRTG